jgi:hypothetical protein
MRAAQEDLSRRLKQGAIRSEEKEMLYYSSWHWSAIHIIVSIPRYQTAGAIAGRLSLPEPFVVSCLDTLEGFGLVTRHKNTWKIATGGIHLAKTSPMNATQHRNWRERAVLQSQRPDDDGLHYTVVQSVSRQDFEKIKVQLLAAVDQYAATANASREEELVCFACDFFRV